MTSKYNWDRMPLEQRLVAAGLDITRHPEFSMLGGVVCTGQMFVEDALSTAATDGIDEFYGREFMMQQSMEQVRWVRLHENYHKALKHCVTARDIVSKYPRESNMAQDYEINLAIYDMDPQERFARRPSGIEICFDEQYRGMSWIEILRHLIKPGKGGKSGQKQGQGQGQGQGGGAGGSFDQHRFKQRSPEEQAKADKAITDAIAQGHIISRSFGKGAGKGTGINVLDRAMRERRTDWREPLRQFVTSIVAGDDMSRFCPPNKRLLPLGFIMPSHFSESSGGFIIAADTSGSMSGVYPVLFGEVARICQLVRPEYVRLLWWDGKVQSEQYFTPDKYDDIGKLFKPVGGGGTTPACVTQYIREKQYKPKAVIWLTDGDFYAHPGSLDIPQLWGVVDNPRFVPTQGKVVHINSLYN